MTNRIVEDLIAGGVGLACVGAAFGLMIAARRLRARGRPTASAVAAIAAGLAGLGALAVLLLFMLLLAGAAWR